MGFRTGGAIGMMALSIAALAPQASAEVINTVSAPCRVFADGWASSDPNERADAEFLLHWLAGRLAPVTSGRVADAVAIAGDGERLAEMCRATPDRPLLDAAATVLGAAGTPPGKARVALSAVTCANLKDLSPEEAIGLASSVMWLLGQEAQRTGAALVDPASIGGHMQRLGVVCRKTPELSLPQALSQTLIAPETAP